MKIKIVQWLIRRWGISSQQHIKLEREWYVIDINSQGINLDYSDYKPEKRTEVKSARIWRKSR